MVWITTLIVLASMWRLFRKAGRPAWAALVPVYDMVIMFRIADRPAWQALAAVFGCAAIAAGRILAPDLSSSMLLTLTLLAITAGCWMSGCVGLAQRFDRSLSFGFGMAMLPMVFFPILAFGPARYDTAPSGVPETLGL